MTTTGLTRPIPPEALPVVKLIRERVPRPKELPANLPTAQGCFALRFVTWPEETKCCPLGLDSSTTFGAPEFIEQFSEDSPFYKIGPLPIKEFGAWWDGEENAQAACDAVWGTETK